MTTIAASAIPYLVTAEWDLESFLTNSQEKLKEWGGLALGVIGVICLIWGGVLVAKKLMASPQQAQQQSGWGTIALLIIVGGALITGGINLMTTISGGGEKTITDLGGSTAIVTTVQTPESVLHVPDAGHSVR